MQVPIYIAEECMVIYLGESTRSVPKTFPRYLLKSMRVYLLIPEIVGDAYYLEDLEASSVQPLIFWVSMALVFLSWVLAF